VFLKPNRTHHFRIHEGGAHHILRYTHLAGIHQHCSLPVDIDYNLADHIGDIHILGSDIGRNLAVARIDHILRIVETVDRVEMIVHQAERNLRPAEMI
jgi:hypothetical protein